MFILIVIKLLFWTNCDITEGTGMSPLRSALFLSRKSPHRGMVAYNDGSDSLLR